MKIVVLAGGLSPERNVSLSSGAMVCQALRDRGHQVALVDLFFGLEGMTGAPEDLYDQPVPESFKKVSPQAPDLKQVRASRKDQSPSAIGPGVLELCAGADIVYLALHGACGEDGRIQAALDLLGVPYTGSGCLASAIAMDKDLTKRLVADKVTTPRWQVVRVSEENLEELVEKTELPVVVKPIDSGSSIGVYIAHTRPELHKALEGSIALGGRTVLEQYIQGREIQVALLDGKALPSIEIIPKEGFYDYENKYQPGAALEVCPAEIPAEWEKRLGEAALEVFRIVGLSVYARADFIVTEDGTPYFLEINTLPGMTPTSLVPQEAAVVGIDYGTLCETIIQKSLEARKEEQ
ncbi:D-alanine--D-alanine ligase [Pseudoflavonifractor sp. AF19-9AC]|uniref:D-alanine--D-alanine ligase n=1 Tax=Pseudoflavonifractor sp. AF19-9AC TaxID=2292244 RepID=UPI000E4FF059|nr:D-alanine--D-alanine ligase [Pseudoflavonifractor sp. AF19-9AC]RHR08918.1 D-alanine--D-alanine ligase [Pseudoflavonifractor sp. AF19-9AC]